MTTKSPRDIISEFVNEFNKVEKEKEELHKLVSAGQTRLAELEAWLNDKRQALSSLTMPKKPTPSLVEAKSVEPTKPRRVGPPPTRGLSKKNGDRRTRHYFTARKFEIANDMLRRGFSVKEIAERINMSPSAVSYQKTMGKITRHGNNDS